ncbi:DNA/RNA helicase domain-containing protein, partial [Aerococcus urinaeequi]
IDEGHLLLSQADPYNNFYGENQLDAIMDKAKVAVLIFDEKQYLKVKSKWQSDDLKAILKKYDANEFHLTDQFRMNASPVVMNWVNDFVGQKVMPLPPSDDHFEFKVFDDPTAFKDYIYQKNADKGLSRIVSTFDFAHKKNGDVYLVDEAGINLPWNTTNSKITWSERPETINEVGSIYTVQGFDLNYVGIVLGPSIDYDFKTERLTIDPSKYQDTGGYSGANRFANYKEAMAAKEQIILNSINVLMKRGIYGLAIYAVNDNLKRKLQKMKVEAMQDDI